MTVFVQEDARRSTAAEEHNAQSARQAALYIHTSFVDSISNERGLSLRFNFEGNWERFIRSAAWKIVLKEKG